MIVADQLAAGRNSDLVPQDLIIEVAIGPMLEMLVGNPFLMRLTIATRGGCQVDVFKVATINDKGEHGEAFTYEVYEVDPDHPSIRDEVTPVGGDYWHFAPLDA